MLLARVFKYSEALRYSLVGVVNTILGITLMLLMAQTGWPYPVYTTCVYLMVFSISFVLNRAYTFKVHDMWKQRMGRFYLFNGANMVLAQLNQAILIEMFKINEGFAVGSGMALYIVIGYFGNKYYVFNKKAQL